MTNTTISHTHHGVPVSVSSSSTVRTVTFFLGALTGSGAGVGAVEMKERERERESTRIERRLVQKQFPNLRFLICAYDGASSYKTIKMHKHTHIPSNQTYKHWEAKYPSPSNHQSYTSQS